jgi:hypothetical protein
MGDGIWVPACWSLFETRFEELDYLLLREWLTSHVSIKNLKRIPTETD